MHFIRLSLAEHGLELLYFDFVARAAAGRIHQDEIEVAHASNGLAQFARRGDDLHREINDVGVRAELFDGRDAILRMGRVLSRLESLDRRLQAHTPHPLLGTSSLHASIINWGRELSSYPERCSLQIERRTLPGEESGVGLQEVRGILDRLRRADADFEGEATLVFSRAAYELDATHPLVEAPSFERLGGPRGQSHQAG